MGSEAMGSHRNVARACESMPQMLKNVKGAFRPKTVIPAANFAKRVFHHNHHVRKVGLARVYMSVEAQQFAALQGERPRPLPSARNNSGNVVQKTRRVHKPAHATKL